MSFPGFPARLHPIAPVVEKTSPPDYGCPACGYALIDEVISDLLTLPTGLHLEGQVTGQQVKYWTECPECTSPIEVRLHVLIKVQHIRAYQKGSDPWDRPEADRDGDL